MEEEKGIEQIHEDWRKGTYEYYLTKKAFQASEDVNTAKKYPLLMYSKRAIASVSSFLDTLISGSGKNEEEIEKLQRKLERLYLLCQKGLSQLNIQHNGTKFVLKWVTLKNPYKIEELINKQIIPIIVGEIFSDAMNIAQQLGYFVQKPIEVKRGIKGLMEAMGIIEDEE